MTGKVSLWRSISPMKMIVGGYCLLILLGTVLLWLPCATRGAGGTPFTDCLFTAASATCVTGLIRFDTATHWTVFGQTVILGLIQIGGVGFMTVAIVILTFTKRKITLSQRSVMQNSIAAPQIGGIVRMSKFIVLGSLSVEGVGALLLSFDFLPRFGVVKGIYYAVFHSVSAFCNAGFDLMGSETGQFSSLTAFRGNWYVNIVIMALIFMGGLGFFVWHDVKEKKFRFKNLNLQSKMVLSLSLGLVVLGALAIFLLEYRQGGLEGISGEISGEMSGEVSEELSGRTSDKVLASLFQSVSARTAGFNTVDLSSMTEAGKLLMICLMLIGGSTGSTAGGMKTTTFWVLCVSIFATFRRKKNIEAFGRRIEEGITRTASCVFMTYLLLVVTSAAVISALEKLPVLTALFETGSAMATVGLSFGVTPSLGMISKLLLIFLMFCGRVGSVTMLLAFSSDKRVTSSSYPMEKIQVG